MLKSFPLIRQHDSMQCGIACLRMLCQQQVFNTFVIKQIGS